MSKHASKAKRNKHYGGRRKLLNPLTMFSSMGNVVHAEYAVEMQTKTAMAMHAITHGQGNKDFWDQLVGAINIAKVLSGFGIGPEFHNTFHDAGEALLEMGVRSVSTKRFVFTGPELKVMQEAMECHTAQLENIRAIDIERAIKEVERRMSDRENNKSVNRELAARGVMREAA